MLANKNILVVEDEYFIAEEINLDLTAAGAHVIGPISTLSGALDAINTPERIDLALLDIKLHDEKVYPLIGELERRAIPFLLLTGYDACMVPPRYGRILYQKPVSSSVLFKGIRALLDGPGRTTGQTIV